MDQVINPATSKEKSPRSVMLFGFALLILIALALVLISVYSLYQQIQLVQSSASGYLSRDWAHQNDLITLYVYTSLVLWASMSGFFYGGWLIRRSVRKLKGRPWKVSFQENNQIKTRFFPPVKRYLQWSCWYFFLVIGFLLLQFPLQFIF